MSVMRRIGNVLVLVVGLALAASAARAAHRDAILGAEGELYRVRTGTYGELFPGGNELDRANPVLALEVVKPDGSVQLHLVPGTKEADVEREPFLQYEEASNTLFLVWESRRTLILPFLRLSAFNGEWLWPDPIDIMGNPFAPKMSPQLAVTQDTYREGGTPRHRTVLHVVWGEEESGSGLLETFYTPVILEDGNFAGRSPVLKLNDLETPAAADDGADPSPELFQALQIHRGRDQRTVVVAFISPANRRLLTVEIDSLPSQLVQLADGARSHIVDIGAKFYPAKIERLGEEARSHIVDIGGAFHLEVVRSIADYVRSYILSEGHRKDPDGLKAIADGARSHIVDIGAKLSGRGLRGTVGVSTTASSLVVEIKPEAVLSTPENLRRSSHILQLRQVSERPAPEVGSGEIRLFLSESGEHVLVAWAEKDRVVYRESTGSGWRAPLEIKLSESLDLAQAFAALETRVRNR